MQKGGDMVERSDEVRRELNPDSAQQSENLLLEKLAADEQIFQED